MARATLDIGPGVLAHVIANLPACARVVGSEEANDIVRLKLDVPKLYAGRLILEVSEIPGSRTVRLKKL